jgi:RNA polymerase-binding protein DksA
VKKSPAKKTTPAKPPAPKATERKSTAAKKAPAPKAAAKKTAAPKSPAARPAQPTRAPRSAKFDAKQLAGIRERLLAEKAELERQQSELDAEGTQSEAMAEIGLDDDFADAGTATFDRERDLSIRNNITDLIDQVTRAVARIDDGTYGTCERCGRPIDAARLKALPHALLCLDCKRREERGR